MWPPNGCVHHADCFSCPFRDCIDNKLVGGDEAKARAARAAHAARKARARALEADCRAAGVYDKQAEALIWGRVEGG